MSTPDFEKLGAFYLGRRHDLESGDTTDETILYDSKDLTTHAVCVGMTGSGKTGLCVGLLEEAAIDGVPAIAIDPKGDLSNLLMTFPQLRPADFEPWVDPGAATRKGMTTSEYAASQAALWKKGLKSWDQDGARIKRFRNAVDMTIYTPGSNAGIPINVLKSFDAPPPNVIQDSDAMRERVGTTASSLLTLLGINADPTKSREHILLSAIIDHAWRQGRNLDLASIIGLIQNPPFDKLGVMPLDSFFNQGDRFSLAMAINGLLASPSFSSWMQGEPLDVGRLLYTAEGKPRLSIISIAHLPESERMFFVSMLLNEVVAWMRTQAGTSSLRALLYMDEVFGYFPPVANPPSKTPMLTLLKQARAYGLGVVLATQNPVDLDYKGLSNTGTWFLGRLQTERDKMRVLEGLEGASVSAGSSFDKQKMEATLAGLGSRVFLMNNVHEDEPVVFHTRWVLSYLRGPMTRVEIQKLMEGRKPQLPQTPTRPHAVDRVADTVTPPAPEAAPIATAPPALPAGVEQSFVPIARGVPRDATVTYQPFLLGSAPLHYVRVSAKVDEWIDSAAILPFDVIEARVPWDEADALNGVPDELLEDPESGVGFGEIPSIASNKKQYSSWEKQYADHVYRHKPLRVYQCKSLKKYSAPNQDQAAFRSELADVLREKRDLAVEKLRKKYTPKLATMRDRVMKAEQKIEREKAQYKHSGLSTAVSVGATVLGALFGRKLASAGNIGRAGTSMRGASRTARERGDIARAEESAQSLRDRLAALEEEFQTELENVKEDLVVEDLQLDEIVVRARKSDMATKAVRVVWMPFRAEGGRSIPAFDRSLLQYRSDE